MKKLIAAAMSLTVAALGVFAFGCKAEEHEHTFAANWSSDANYHWHASTCGHPETEKKESHSIVNGKCEICDYTPSHQHSYIKSVHEADCTQEGYELYECACGASYRQNPVPALGHELNMVKVEPTCTQEGSITYSCTHCDYTRKTTLSAEHKYNWYEGEDYFECIECFHRIPATQGLQFREKWSNPFGGLFGGNKGDFLGYSLDSAAEASGDVIIPAYFEDEEVTDISNYAFQDNFDITSVQIPETIKEIGLMAFENCSLASVNIPTSMEYIGSMAFSGCTNLQTVKFYGDVECIEAWAFSDTAIIADENYYDNGAFYIDGHLIDASGAKGDFTVKADTLSIAARAFEDSSVTKVNLPRGLKYISEYAFLECETLEEIKIPEKITTITYKCFNGCTALKTIYIPLSVELIDNGALGQCTSLETINYGGSPDDWAAINKEAGDGEVWEAWDEGSGGYTVVYAK